MINLSSRIEIKDLIDAETLKYYNQLFKRNSIHCLMKVIKKYQNNSLFVENYENLVLFYEQIIQINRLIKLETNNSLNTKSKYD